MYRLLILFTLLYPHLHFAQTSDPGQDYLMISESTILFYETLGRGDTVIIIHGGPGLDHTYLLPQLGELSDEFTLIFYDQRGIGKSECVVDSNSVTLENFVNDLEDLRKELKLDKMNLLGHSWGGFLAMNYAINFPDKANKVILVSTLPASSEYLPEFLNIRENRRTENDKLRLAEMMSSDSLFLGDVTFMERLTRLFFKSYFYNPDLVNELTITFSKNTAKNFLPVYTMMSRYFSNYDLNQQLKELQNEILIIYGNYDVIPIKYLEELNTILPNSKLVTIQNCGHFPFAECNTEFINLCKNFLNEP